MACILEEAGINAFRMHGAVFETYYYVVPPACVPRGVYAPVSKGINETLKEAKVMFGHRINDSLLGEDILQREMADIILMGKPLIAAPELPRKVKEGRLGRPPEMYCVQHMRWQNCDGSPGDMHGEPDSG